jgi:hypothetical protein
MSMWKCSFFYVLLIMLILFCSCRMVNFSDLEYTVYPSERNQVISGNDTVWIEFSLSPNKSQAEELLEISSASGAQDGDKYWDGKRLYFQAVPSWESGVRYTLSFDGSLTAGGDLSFDLNIVVPFFVNTSTGIPELIDYSPDGGGSIAVNTPLEFTFSSSIDGDSFKESFSLSPDNDFDIVWNADNTIATITPEDAWANLTVYTWTISSTLMDINGLELCRSYSATFIVQVDDEAPVINSVVPAYLDWGNDFPETGFPLTQIGYSNVIKVTFSEPVDLSSFTITGFDINPSVTGAIHQILDGSVFVFIPQEGYLMDQLYHLTISTDVEDLSGNYLSEPYDEWFVPNIQPVVVETILLVDDSIPVDMATYDSNTVIEINLGGNHEYYFRINFLSGAFPGFDSDSARAAVTGKITLTEVFPGSASCNLISANWLGDYVVDLQFTDLEESEATSTYYYVLKIPGGPEGIKNGYGSLLREDIELYLKTAVP